MELTRYDDRSSGLIEIGANNFTCNERVIIFSSWTITKFGSNSRAATCFWRFFVLMGFFFYSFMKAFKDTGKAPVETEVAIHRIRITLTSRNVKSLEKGK